MCSNTENMATKQVPFQWSLLFSEPERDPQIVPHHQDIPHDIHQDIPQDIKHFLSMMGSNSVLHEPHLVEIMVTLDNGGETIFPNFHIFFNIYCAVNEYWIN